MSQPTPFLLTGVTGGLGAKILSDMLGKHHIDPKSIIATSRSESNKDKFEKMGVQFRVADYNRPETLESAFENVKEVLFMSSSQRNNAIRNREHLNVTNAAKKMNVGRVWYVSLAFGGWGDGSKIGFQQAHYETESQLQSSGVDFVSLRAGVYTDAFPLFLNWYPSDKSVLMPKLEPSVYDSKIAFTSRDELGEGMATLLVKGPEESGITPKTAKNIILLTARETNSLPDLVGAISKAQGKEVPVEILESQAWIDECARDDLGGKGKAWFEARLVFTQGVCDGDATVMDPALEKLLGRKPETGVQGVERLIKEAGGEFYWHQNHISGDWSGMKAGK